MNIAPRAKCLLLIIVSINFVDVFTLSAAGYLQENRLGFFHKL